jgi:hypothetical protein
VVDKMEDKFGAQNDTAPTQCMEAVKIVRGRGGRGGESRPVNKSFDNHLPLKTK